MALIVSGSLKAPNFMIYNGAELTVGSNLNAVCQQSLWKTPHILYSVDQFDNCKSHKKEYHGFTRENVHVTVQRGCATIAIFEASVAPVAIRK